MNGSRAALILSTSLWSFEISSNFKLNLSIISLELANADPSPSYLFSRIKFILNKIANPNLKPFKLTIQVNWC